VNTLIDKLLDKSLDVNASDIHLTVGLPPMFRVNGNLISYGGDILTPDDTEKIVGNLIDEDKFSTLKERGEIDFSVSVHTKYRLRINCFKQRGSYAIAIRNINSSIMSLEQLGLPENVRDFTNKSQGIVLVTGPTGSGKSTTLATLIDIINQTRQCHILTLEDPIEHLHKHKRSIVNQREIGTDSKSYHNALRAALREDPDVILIGEMRDHESVAIALTAAETGHLVFSTLHTLGAAKSIDRIIDVFPPDQQHQIRLQLSMTLIGIISQQLLPLSNGKGRKVSSEVMVATPAIRHLIRENKTPQINNAIATGSSFGMLAMDNSLLKLYKSRDISYEDLLLRCIDNDYIKKNVSVF